MACPIERRCDVSQTERIRPEGFLGWRMVALAVCAQTCAVGLAYGVNGSIITWIQEEFHTTRTLASAGMPAILLAQALVAPLIGDLLRRSSVRSIMISGALIYATGHVALFFVQDIYLFLAVYACMLGPGYCMLSHVVTSTLVVNWFGGDRGQALGIANIPIALLLFPPIAAAIVLAYGARTLFLSGAVLSLAVVPLLAFIVSKPSGPTPCPTGDAASKSPRPGSLSRQLLTRQEIVRTSAFWLILLGNGIFVAAGATMAIILVPFAQSKGIALEWAAVAMSCYGFGTIIGAPIWGLVVDHAGPSRTFVVLAIIEALAWASLYFFGNTAPVIISVGGLIGFCSGGAAVPLLTATIGIWVDQYNFSRVLGLIYLLKMPLSVGGPILSGIIFDFFGNYQALLLIFIALMTVNALIFSFYEIRKLKSGP